MPLLQWNRNTMKKTYFLSEYCSWKRELLSTHTKKIVKNTLIEHVLLGRNALSDLLYCLLHPELCTAPHTHTRGVLLYFITSGTLTFFSAYFFCILTNYNFYSSQTCEYTYSQKCLWKNLTMICMLDCSVKVKILFLWVTIFSIFSVFTLNLDAIWFVFWKDGAWN